MITVDIWGNGGHEYYEIELPYEADIIDFNNEIAILESNNCSAFEVQLWDKKGNHLLTTYRNSGAKHCGKSHWY